MTIVQQLLTLGVLILLTVQMGLWVNVFLPTGKLPKIVSSKHEFGREMVSIWASIGLIYGTTLLFII